MTKEHNLEMLDMIGRDTPGDEIESLRAQLAAANAEVQEQARLNGMGAEREAKLRAQLDEGHRQLLATQAIAARMAYALADAKAMAGKPEEVYRITKAALSTPINLGALLDAMAERGYVLVDAKKQEPAEPTTAMLAAGMECATEEYCYRAMLSAAPTPPTQPQGDGSLRSGAEHEYAIKEGARISACEWYFNARPQIDCLDRRRVFEAGFDRGYDAAMEASNG